MEKAISQLIDLALVEDIGTGDVTSGYFVPADKSARAFICAREEGVLAGTEIAAEVFRRVEPETEIRILIEDGSRVSEGALVMEISGSARAILTAERVALNFLQRLCGVATLTSQFVEKIRGTDAQILDTRKTTPGWRLLEKQAVLAGGGTNHRMGLFDRAMVKDNHLVAESTLTALQESISQLKTDHPEVEVELEVDRLEQYEDFMKLEGVDYILLDNMSLADLRLAVERREGATPLLEASGGVNLETVQAIASTGVDYISVGAITHSATGLDLALDFVEED